MFYFRFSLLLVLLTLKFQCALFADSTDVRHWNLDLNLAGSFISLANWKTETLHSFTVLMGVDYYFKKTKEGHINSLSIKSELGFTRIIDSVWNKNIDQFEILYIVKRNAKMVSQTWNGQLHSQFLTGYNYSTNFQQQKSERQWSGTFMNPSSFELGYGFGISFWKQSLLNISLASARIRVDPITENSIKASSGVFGKVNRGWLVFDYGVAGQLQLIKILSGTLEWSSSGNLFMNGFRKEAIQFDVSNTMSYKFWNFVEMRANLKWVYDPLVSLRMQYRNELLFGFKFKFEK